MTSRNQQGWSVLGGSVRVGLVCLSGVLLMSHAACEQSNGLPAPPGSPDAALEESPDEAAPRSMVQRPRRPRRETPRPERDPDPSSAAARFPAEFRPINGTGNNEANPHWGSADQPFLRLAAVAYEDGSNTPSGSERPSARAISNAVAAQDGDIPNDAAASDYLWQWGQFLDHDIDETPVADPSEPFDIAVPAGDPHFDPLATGSMVIPLDRSAYHVIDSVRMQFNAITAYIDASNVYGSDAERAEALRANDGTGRLATSSGNQLPFNTAGLENAPAPTANFFLAGDIRANEQVGLTAMHVLFMREHNRIADAIREAVPGLDGDTVFELTRAIVAAEMQAITYREFLPVLLGDAALPPYRGYRSEVNAGISNEFATAAYRLGHSMLSRQLLRLDADGNEAAEGHLSLASAFFNTQALLNNGIDSILRGLAGQAAQKVDAFVIDEVRNFLFGPPGAGGFDLVSLNIQRGRDHGLASLNETRTDLGLPPHEGFADFTPNVEVQARLALAYGSPEDVDLWMGGLAEDHAADGLVGETFRAILVDQFVRLRDGDRFYYRAYLPRKLVEYVETRALSCIIRDNSGIGDELPDDVFSVSAAVAIGTSSEAAQEIGALIAEILNR